MKNAILNYSGTVGKTTVSAHVFAPRMPGAAIFAVETINEAASGLGLDVEQIAGGRFRSLYQALVELDDAIVDVGSSNVEQFMVGLLRFAGSTDEIDQFIIPTTSGMKEQRETRALITTLARMGVPRNKIRVLFNRVESSVAEEFSHVCRYAEKERNCIADQRVAVFENEIFDLLNSRQLTIAAALQDSNDYKAMLRGLGADGDPKLRSLYCDMLAIKSLAVGVNRQLDRVFGILTEE